MKALRTPLFLTVFGLLLFSCTYFEKDPIIIPVPDETEDLEVAFVETPPSSVNNPYWTSISDFTRISISDQTLNQVDGNDGVLNVNNMQDGLADFNEGNSPELILKAAYDDEYLYILAEWKDISYNPSSKNWLFNGPVDPDNPGQDNLGWTSQRSSDQLILEFTINGSEKDIWNWNFALSEAMGYAIDQYDDGSGIENDAGEPMFNRNVNGSTDRSGPMYEWDGEQQELSRPLSGFTLLDPGFFLLNKTAFLGDINNGEVLYIQECEECHGENGDGEGSFGVPLPLNGEGGLNRLSRTAFGLFAESNEHTGNNHWTILNTDEKDDVIAFIRGLSGVPGYYLTEPSGSVSDIEAGSTTQLALVNTRKDNPGYKVLLTRKLNTGNPDDIQFNLSEKVEYDFEVFLRNDDNLNKIGSTSEVLIFK